MASATLSQEDLEFHGHVVGEGDDPLRRRLLHAEVLPREREDPETPMTSWVKVGP